MRSTSNQQASDPGRGKRLSVGFGLRRSTLGTRLPISQPPKCQPEEFWAVVEDTFRGGVGRLLDPKVG